MDIMHNTQELQASKAFNKQASLFDTLYRDNPIIQYKRSRVREHVMQYLQPGNRMLELNAGTGEDATFFAEQGIHIHATDISEGMLEILQNKIERHGLQHMVSKELRSFTALQSLNDKGPFDLIFSNFAGLNCTGQLDKVLKSFHQLLKPGGTIVLVIMPPFCLWESLLLFRGNFKNAIRRFKSRDGAEAKIEGVPFRCWYYSPHFVVRTLSNEFDLLALEGLSSIVPPSYLEAFPSKYPKLFKMLVKLEDACKGKWPWKHTGDYYIISMKRNC
jgi:ubiquinone/menaquinone biosynthesis C-methylase UbiE